MLQVLSRICRSYIFFFFSFRLACCLMLINPLDSERWLFKRKKCWLKNMNFPKSSAALAATLWITALSILGTAASDNVNKQLTDNVNKQLTLPEVKSADHRPQGRSCPLGCTCLSKQHLRCNGINLQSGITEEFFQFPHNAFIKYL